MKNVDGLWLPDRESPGFYFMKWLAADPGAIEHYDDDLHAAVLRALPDDRRDLALDVGANVGLWTRMLTRSFAFVHAFEPFDEAAECLRRNVAATNYELHPYALGDRDGTTDLAFGTGTSLKTRVHGAVGGVAIRQLDSIPLQRVDFIKIDCEGFDYFVLVGAEATITRDRPVILFEAKPKVSWKRYRVPDDGPRRWLEERGYSLAHDHGNGNFVMVLTWP